MRCPLTTCPLLFVLAAHAVALLAHDLHGEDPWVLGIEELHRLDLLPRFKRSIEVGSVSSYDRTGGNNDGFSGQFSYVRKEEGGLVIADLKGPGIIYRIWTPTPTDDLVEFYFDGEEKPRIAVKFRDIFTGRAHPFVRPLVGFGAGGFYCYLPLPYSESCKVLVNADRVQFYQINFARYPAEAPIRTFEAQPATEYPRAAGAEPRTAYQTHLARARHLFASSGKDISEFTAPPGSQRKVESVRKSLAAGKTVTLFERNEPGRIVGLRLSPALSFETKDRDLVLRIFWDGEEKPAIACPVGDFFGYAWGEPATRSIWLGTSGETNYCYYPMPFDRYARIEIASERASGPEVEIHAETTWTPVPRDPSEGKLYALWRRENPTTRGVPFTFVKTEGRGHVVGCIQQSQGFESGNTYFFEGDDQTTIDDRLAIHGTGSEDFYNGGWYDVPGRWEKRRSFPLSGCLAYKKHLARTGGYRLMIGDAYAYRKSIEHVIEHAPTENSLINDYCAVTFLYSQRRPTCDMNLPAVEKRKVVDLERIVYTAGWNVPLHAFSFRNATITKKTEKVNDKEVSFLSLRAEGRDWFGHHFISFRCEIPAGGKYEVFIEALRGPEQARVRLFRDEAPVGAAVDLYSAEKTVSGPLSMGTLELSEGMNNLLFKLVDKSEDSKGLGLDLVHIVCVRSK